MKYQHNPVEYINRIQKEKYKMLAVPMVIIVINFALNFFYNIHFIKYLSAFAMLMYLVVLYLYRISHPSIEMNESNLLAPVNGKVKEIIKKEKNYQILIEKSWYESCEMRTMSNLDEIDQNEEGSQASFLVKGVWARVFSKRVPHLQGQLIGVAPAKCIALIRIPYNYELSISENDHVEAGVSILATSKNSSSVSNEGRDDE